MKSSRAPSRSRQSSLNMALNAISKEGSRHNDGRTTTGAVHVEGDKSTYGLYQDPPSTMPEFSNISSSHGGYFTSLLSQDFQDELGNEDNEEVENEVMEVSPMSGITSNSKIKGRSKNFSEDEDNLLVSAWLNVGQDPVDGNQQKNATFWGRVEKYYHEHRTFDSDRNWSSLKHRWGTIKKEVSIFQGFHENVERRNESGKTSNDKIVEAKAMFQQLQKKVFCLFHAWNILKHEPKWAAERECRNGKNSLEANNGGDEAKPNSERPPGRKAEKAARKRGDSESDPFIEELKKMREDRQHIEKERKERDDRFFLLEKQKMDLEQEQHDKNIMDTDTTAMDKESQLYFKLKKEEILARRFGRTQ